MAAKMLIGSKSAQLRFGASLLSALGGVAIATSTLAQTVPAPAPVQSQPLAPPAGTPAPPAAPTAPPPTAPAPAAPSAPAPAAMGPAATLAPAPADPSTPDEVTIAGKPAATLRGAANWDEGYDKLTEAFARLQAEVGKAGLKPVGKPLATFLKTDDNGFEYEAQLPVDAAPIGRPAGLSSDIQFGQTPAGRAIRFVHKAPYDDIDSTYEAISAYLDAKGIEAKDNFTEEYVNQGQNAGDAEIEIFIYVLPK
ncbi:AraC family transcriptional regulator [Alsobacter metallidurans]|uniref:AraC family transcriptional regulator n=2 Tax=Alsobacter metallidurans TaxID=340221 RepID=A0A917IB90_9HYPH|nr:AraC family transcriptional regulator [Alsobacter metallidurans]